MNRRGRALLLLAVAAVGISGGCQGVEAGRNRPAAVADDAATVAVTIRSAGGTHVFRVEMARTPMEQSRGLMYRTELAPDGGMLFPFDPPRPAAFWMKNTYIPLDMIFIGEDSRIARIAANTTPYSLEPVESGVPVIAVLEIAGGRAEASGLAVGDKVHWP